MHRHKRHTGKLALGAVAATITWAWIARPPVSWTLRRTLATVSILLVVSFVVFAPQASLPGDPAVVILGMGATHETVVS